MRYNREVSEGVSRELTAKVKGLGGGLERVRMLLSRGPEVDPC